MKGYRISGGPSDWYPLTRGGGFIQVRDHRYVFRLDAIDVEGDPMRLFTSTMGCLDTSGILAPPRRLMVTGMQFSRKSPLQIGATELEFKLDMLESAEGFALSVSVEGQILEPIPVYQEVDCGPILRPLLRLPSWVQRQ